MAAPLQTVCWSIPPQKGFNSSWKSHKKNTISPRLLPRRNFHFKSYLWGRKLHNFQAGIIQTTSPYQVTLESRTTPQRHDGLTDLIEQWHELLIGQSPVNQGVTSRDFGKRLGRGTLAKYQNGGFISSFVKSEKCAFFDQF